MDIELLKNQIKERELLANWWIASASTGHAKSRSVFHGTGGVELTDQEKVDDAMETALKHIHIHRELSEALLEARKKEELDKREYYRMMGPG